MKRVMLVSFFLGLVAGSVWGAEPAAPASRLEVEADYLHWWVRKPSFNVPLLTTGAAGGFGEVGAPDTQVLIGNGEGVPFDGQSGFRAGATYWLGEGSDALGLHVGGFFLGQAPAGETFGSDAGGNPLLAQPIIDPALGPQSLLVSAPGVLAGTYANSSTTSLFGWEVNGVYDFGSGGGGLSVRGLAGFRHLGLRDKYAETVGITDPLGATGVLTFNPAPTSGLGTLDEFRADTDFYGLQVGTRVGYRAGRVGVDFTGKVALGVSQQRVNISGLTTNVDGQTLPGGLHALSSNIGRHTSSDFAVAPEVGVNVSYQLTEGIALRAGYSFLYLSRVARAVDQIDPVTDVGLVPSDGAFGLPGGEARPRFERQASDFWAHGLNVGLTIEF